MADNWKTKLILLEGGLVLNQSPIQQGLAAPGSAIVGVNYEPSLSGGYRRMSGYGLYDPAPVPGTGPVLGTYVFDDGVIACRGDRIAFSVGSGWTEIQPALRTDASRYRAVRYSWLTPTIILVDGHNKPLKYDGTTAVELTTAPIGATCVTEHKSCIWFGRGSVLTFSAPNSDTNYNATNGAGSIQVGSEIMGLASWRGDLFILCRNAIYRVTGDSLADFALVPVTKKLGCIAGDSLQEVGGDLVYLAADGIRTVSGTDKIGDVQLGSLSKAVQPRVADFLRGLTTARFSSCIVRSKSQYRLFVSTDTTAADSAQGILGGLRQGADGPAWEWFDLRGIRATCADSEYLTDGTELVVHGDLDGMVYRQEYGNSLNGRDLPATVQLAWNPYDDPALRKTLFQARINMEVEGTMNVRLSLQHDFAASDIQPAAQYLTTTAGSAAVYDDASTIYDDEVLDVFDKTGDPMFRVPLEGSGFVSSFVFWSEDQNAPHTIKTITIEYALGGRV